MSKIEFAGFDPAAIELAIQNAVDLTFPASHGPVLLTEPPSYSIERHKALSQASPHYPDAPNFRQVYQLLTNLI